MRQQDRVTKAGDGSARQGTVLCIDMVAQKRQGVSSLALQPRGIKSVDLRLEKSTVYGALFAVFVKLYSLRVFVA